MTSKTMNAYDPLQGRYVRVLLAAFGVVWLINAAYQASAWLVVPDAGAHFVHALSKSASTVPAWIQPLLLAGMHGVQALGPSGVAGVMVAIDILLGLALLTRWLLAPAAWTGLVYSLLCWVFLNGFGFPYGNGQTDPGVFMAYAITFLFVLAVVPVVTSRDAQAGMPDPKRWRFAVLAYGLLWLFDAALKWFPGFLLHFSSQITSVIPGQPHWVAAWLTFVAAVIGFIGPVFVAILVALSETVIALALLAGARLRWIIPFGMLYSLSVWVTAESFGGPYSVAGTGVRGDVLGNVLIYLLPFLFLWVHIRRDSGPLALHPPNGS